MSTTMDPTVVGMCAANPDRWSAGDSELRSAAAADCMTCPLLRACAAHTRHQIEAGQRPTAIVQAGVAFDISGAVDPLVHGGDGAALIAEAFNAPVGPGGVYGRIGDPDADIPLLTDEQIRDALAKLDRAGTAR